MTSRPAHCETDAIEALAGAVGVLKAWIDLPYRIRRRPDDDAATLQALIDDKHRVAREMIEAEVRLTAHSAALAACFADARAELAPHVSAALYEAFTCEPMLRAGIEQQLDDWGPGPASRAPVSRLVASASLLRREADATVDRPDVLAEVTAASDRYEAALATDDVETMDLLFWDDARVVRLGVTENLHGASEIRSFRRGRVPGGAARTNLDRTITTFGDLAAVVVQHFERDGRRGRQSQTWMHLDGSWRVVQAHISFLTGPIPPDHQEQS